MEVFEHIFEHLPDGLLVVDEDGRISHANSTAARLFGYPVSALQGRLVDTLVPERLRAQHGVHRRGFQAGPQSRLSRTMGLGLELLGLKADGSEFPIDVVLSPMQTEGRRQVVCVVRDISDRPHAKARFRGLLESAPDAMVIVDGDGRVVLVNTQTERVFGYAREELLGQAVEMLIPARYRHSHLSHRHGYFNAPRVRNMGAGLELNGLRKDGSEFPIEISLSPLQTDSGVLISSAIRDVTEQVRARQLLLDSLRDKEVLLKEVHHRVKNNLAVIASLLYLESTTTTHEPVLKLLQESRDRVRSMSLVHETLYQSGNLASVDFADYARTLGEELARSYRGSGAQVVLQTEMQTVHLGIDIAVPCGLILNELLTNAFKHAYPGPDKGRIEIHLAPFGHRHCQLRVVDHGVGLQEAAAAGQGTSLGQRLVRSLARQLDARFEYMPVSQGTEARLTVALERT